MAKKKEPTFGELLLQGAREAAAHVSGDEAMMRRSRVTRRPITARQIDLRRPSRPSPGKIRKIRSELDLSQAVFSDLLNVSASTVRAWEQGQRVPDGPSLRLLELAEHRPAALLDLAGAKPRPATAGARKPAGKASRTKIRKAG